MTSVCDCQMYATLFIWSLCMSVVLSFIVSLHFVGHALTFQQDGALHHIPAIHNLVSTHLLGWIGQQGAIEWPAHSPNLTPCDFGLWGLLKD